VNDALAVLVPPAECRECGGDLAGQEGLAQRRHQVTDIRPTSAPEVTGHVAQSKRCPCYRTVTEGEPFLPCHGKPLTLAE
jgi:hypothetical protein